MKKELTIKKFYVIINYVNKESIVENKLKKKLKFSLT